MKRILSLDVMRGFVVMCMILVNNGYGPTFAILEHSEWNGMTPCDLVFPFFLFLVGVSIAISFTRPLSTKDRIRKVIIRTASLFAIGLFLNAWNMLIRGDAVYILERLRFTGVLQRIAICYCISSLFFLWIRRRFIWHSVVFILVAYTFVLFIGHGYNEDSSQNWLSIIDKRLLGSHMLLKAYFDKVAVDPEGLISTIPAIAHTLIGIGCGNAFLLDFHNQEKAFRLFVISVALGLTGYLVSLGLPLNKQIWSPSFVLTSCSFAAGVLGILTLAIDHFKKKNWTYIFQVFGLNVFFLYIASQMIPVIFVRIGILPSLYEHLSQMFVWLPEIASLIYALIHVAFFAIVAWLLYRKKCVIKI